MQKEIPESVKSLFWSSPSVDLDIVQDAPQIVHKVLALGDLNDVRWLKKTYDQPTLRRLFQEKPVPIYTPSAFHFATDIVLGMHTNSVNKKLYVKSVY